MIVLMDFNSSVLFCYGVDCFRYFCRVTVVSVVVTKPRQFHLRVQAQHHVEGNIERLSKSGKR